jgi:hypothetical protein
MAAALLSVWRIGTAALGNVENVTVEASNVIIQRDPHRVMSSSAFRLTAVV